MRYYIVAFDTDNRPELTVRRMPFTFDDDINVKWHPDKPEWSYMVNAASLAMPFLEPYLIRTMKKALPKIEDPALHAEIKGYIGQEAQHYQQHKKFNDVLKASGYPGLEDIEKQMAAEFDHFEKHKSLEFNLTYAAGFESMALALGHWLIKHREYLFGGSDSRVASLILWHFVEEIEHKNAAFDAYQALHGKYWYRIYGIFFASLHVMKHSRRGYIAMMKKDGHWGNVGSRLNIIRYNLKFLGGLGYGLLSSFLPNHHPSDTKDPEWSDRWIKNWEEGGEKLELLDTNNLTSPVGAG